MADKTFVDTNILVYAHDAQAGQKQSIAARLLEGLWENQKGVLSLQVLQEFYVTLTRKILKPLSAKATKNILKQYAYWEVVSLNTEDLFSAMDLETKYRVSFWDALIIQAALNAECTLLFSEDFQGGQKISGLTIRNPFDKT